MSERHARAREALRAAEAQTQRVGQPQASPVSDGGDDAEEHVAAALRFVLRSTQNRPQSEAEVAGKLRQRDYDEHTIEQAVAAAKRQGIVDDAAFAAGWVDDRGLKRGFGARRLRDELAGRGVDDADIEAALSRLEGRDELQTALRLARARARQLPGNLGRDALVRRLGTYLMRRGHPPGLAERAAREIAGQVGEG